MTETRDKLIIETELRGAEQAKAGLKGVQDGLAGVSRESERTEKSTGNVDSKFRSLERQFGTTAGQAEKLASIQKKVNDAVAQNPALQSRANDVLAAASARIITTAKANEALVKSTGLARHELINLSRQAQDVAVSLGSGQSFSTVLLQQGTQIADVFANSQGSVRGFFEQLGSGVGRVLTPMRLLAGGIAAVGTAALYIGNNWAEAQREIDQALIGIGRRSGETRQSINRFASENSSALGLSVSEARSVAIEFAKTGNVAASSLKGVGDAVRGYSILTGKGASEATKELAGALSGDLVAAALKVDSVYGVMNAATLENIRALEAQGERAQAVQLILDRMAPVNQKAAESVGVLSKAWSGLTNVLSNIVNGPSTSPASDDIQGQIASLQQQRERAASSRGVGIMPGGGINTAAAYGGKAAELAEFDKQIDALQAKLNSLSAEHAAAQLDKLSMAAFAIGQAILPQIDAIAKLDGAIRKMQEAQSKGVGPANSSGMIAVLQHQKDLQQESLDATIRQAQYVWQLQSAWGGVSAATAVTLQSLRDQENVARQITGAGQMRAQQQVTINGLLAEGRSLEEATAIAVAQSDVARAAATANVERQTQSLKDQLAMVRAQQSGTEATTAAAIAYRQAIESGASATSAAAAKAATLRLHIERAAAAALQLENAALQSAYEQDAGEQEAFSRSYRGWQNTPSTMGSGGSSRSEFEVGANPFRSGWTDPEFFAAGAQVRAIMEDFNADMAPIRERHQGIIDDLNRSIEEQTRATEENTQAITVGLNPLYTQGRGSAIEFGYMHAAKGLDVIAQGPTVGDQMPFHAMVNGGERIQILTKEQQAASNDNKSSALVVNNTITVVESGSTSRRSSRQVGQKYGQMMAALS